MSARDRQLGAMSAIPQIFVLVGLFLAPFVVVLGFSSQPQGSLQINNIPDFAAFRTIITEGYLQALAWSVGLAVASTLILLVVCWPLAFAMARVFGKFGLFVSMAVVASLFVSENVRLFGWVLTLMKGGLISGYMEAWLGIELEGMLYNVPSIVFGLVYVYLPFMLFPVAQGIAMVPEDARMAAADLGATRWQIFCSIDVPLAMPGITVGCLLSFVLAVGAVAEAKLLGGQTVIVMTEEIETAFTYGQDWPLGSALSVCVIVLVGCLSIFALARVDLDSAMGRAKE